MRVITGIARGRKLQTLDGEDVRPTTDRVKEAIFSIVQFDIEGRNVLDLFAGSGQLGIEALSRGAKSAVFVDSNSDAIEIVKKNLAAAKLLTSAIVLETDCCSFLRSKGEKFDLAFLDPPYRKGILQKALPIVTEHMNKGGIIVCESGADEEMPEDANDFKLLKQYRYGKTKVTTYSHKDVDSK